jgi:prealbumin domain-containing protein
MRGSKADQSKRFVPNPYRHDKREAIVSRRTFQSPVTVVGIIATLLGSLLLTSVVALAAGNPSATLDQCANGSLSNPDGTPCQSSSEWVNGNLGSSKAHYSEGDSVPYRFTFGNLATGATIHAVTLEWDTTKSSKHALDYITTWNRTVTSSNPCIGVSGCSLGTFDTEPIPADPQVTGFPVTQIPGNFTLFGGTITGVSTYSYSNGTGFVGDKSARLTVSFTSTVANPVLAWGGHIATRQDWGNANSAVAIPGSPYHMRLIDLDGSGGNQDRSLSADAVVFPGSITIIKDALPDDAQDFAFAATGGLATPFSLDDDADGTLSNTKLYPGITSFVTYTVAETTVSGWTVSFATPPCVLTSGNGGGSSASGSTVTINMKEGESYSCTFTNTRSNGTIILNKSVTNSYGGNAGVNDFGLTIGGTAVNSGGSISATPGTAYAINEAGLTGYTFVSITGTGCPGALGGTVTVAAGQTVTCTITNRDVAPTLALDKTVSNLQGGGASEDDFVLSATATGSTITDAGGDVPATPGISNVEYTLSETSVTGYTAGTWSCSGSGVHQDATDDTKVTLDEGAVGTCAITNTDSKNDPNGSTTMAWTLQDSASYTIRAGASDAASATIDFKLYSDAGCLTQEGTTETKTVTVSGGGVTASAGTTTGYDVGVGTWYWRSFYSGDGYNNAASTACGSEVTTISDDSPTP